MKAPQTHMAIITIGGDGNESKLKKLSYNISKGSGDSGEAIEVHSAVEIEIVKDSRQMKGFFTKWMSDPDQFMDGKIVIYVGTTKRSKFKTIEFENAYVTSYNEVLMKSSNCEETIKFTAQIVKIDDAEFEGDWSDSDA